MRDEDGVVLETDIEEILSFLGEPLRTFPDRSAKWLLANSDNLRALLQIIGSDLVNALDFSRVQRVNTTFIADNLREQESDLVFLVPFQGVDQTEVMIYILLEHQSTPDPSMGFRLLFYMCQIWDQQRQKWLAEKVPKREWRFRPIIPVVFYTGQQEWRSLPVSVETLMDVPPALLRFIPKFETLFLGIGAEPDATFLKTGHPLGWLLTLVKRQDAEPAVFIEALERFGEHLGTQSAEDGAAWKQAIYFLHLLIFHKRSSEEREVLEQILSEHQGTFGLTKQEVDIMQTLAEHYLQQGIEQGIERGARETTIENTVAILTTRFT
ncbi:MAG: Rpn family recombination-promoting nuclease/putative transposase, partial [Candidatus Poribacteria bacterium]|nr:Rpn family recombination-promoting nuclease/putative transposase [Candidatus Poribacteria bacterium]